MSCTHSEDRTSRGPSQGGLLSPRPFQGWGDQRDIPDPGPRLAVTSAAPSPSALPPCYAHPAPLCSTARHPVRQGPAPLPVCDLSLPFRKNTLQ